jgi:hypothetical protein
MMMMMMLLLMLRRHYGGKGQFSCFVFNVFSDSFLSMSQPLLLKLEHFFEGCHQVALSIQVNLPGQLQKCQSFPLKQRAPS